MKPEQQHMSMARGTIATIDPKTRSLTIHGLVLNKTFQLADDAVIATSVRPTGTLTDLRVGDLVEVTYEEHGSVEIAHRIAEAGGAAEHAAGGLQEAA